MRYRPSILEALLRLLRAKLRLFLSNLSCRASSCMHVERERVVCITSSFTNGLFLSLGSLSFAPRPPPPSLSFRYFQHDPLATELQPAVFQTNLKAYDAKEVNQEEHCRKNDCGRHHLTRDHPLRPRGEIRTPNTSHPFPGSSSVPWWLYRLRDHQPQPPFSRHTVVSSKLNLAQVNPPSYFSLFTKTLA